MKNRILLLIILACTASLNAFGHGGGEAEIEVGPDKGVTEVTKDKSFKLSPEARKHLGLKTLAYTAGTLITPKSALVSTLKESQVFRLRDGYLKAIHFKPLTKDEKTISIQSPELRAGDEVVTEGVGFLRIIAAQLGEEESEKEEDGHQAGKLDAHGEEHHD